MESWDKDFYNVSQPEIFDLLLAANYLDIKCLYKAGCKTVAKMIKECKNPEEIRKKFNCENDFTPEEEEKIRRVSEVRDGRWVRSVSLRRHRKTGRLWNVTHSQPTKLNRQIFLSLFTDL